MRYETTVEIAAATPKVWAALMEVERWPEWTASTTSIERLDEVPLALGSEVRIKQPKLRALVWAVTEFDEGRSFSWTSRSGGLRTLAEHRLEPRGESTAVTLSIDQSGFLARIVAVVTSGMTRRYVDTEAQGLKARCEAP